MDLTHFFSRFLYVFFGIWEMFSATVSISAHRHIGAIRSHSEPLNPRLAPEAPRQLPAPLRPWQQAVDRFTCFIMFYFFRLGLATQLPMIPNGPGESRPCFKIDQRKKYAADNEAAND